MGYAFVVDSNNQLEKSLLVENNIDQVPTSCSIGDDCCYDDVTITAPEFLHKMLERLYRKRLDEEKIIVSMHMSSNMSKATYETVDKQVNKIMTESLKLDFEKLKGEKVVCLIAAMADNHQAAEGLKVQLDNSGVPVECLSARMNACQVVCLGPKSWAFGYAVV